MTVKIFISLFLKLLMEESEVFIQFLLISHIYSTFLYCMIYQSFCLESSKQPHWTFSQAILREPGKTNNFLNSV